ncbi:hypothetical protein BD626DRAFT_539108 [Schizophyllum amplum]|uniref:F-box domain-containing protein n=1 Tax=Schizophyllum amplum TaxID=97359 RepID=A0A550C5C9_9AGAR|nr:hypothetical protein BD626DRAFT_539108 [Auriculariopsis ampla]
MATPLLGAHLPASGAILPGLPADVLINIQGFLKPSDIIALRQTSRALRDATLHRTVWINALRSVIDANNIFPPTFPLRQMSIAELEHAALAPRRFFTLASRRGVLPGAGKKIATVSRRAVLLKMASDLPPTDAINAASIRLLPGGRYLIAHTHHVIHLYDLGYSLSPVISTTPIFTLRKSDLTDVDVGNGSLWFMSQYRSADNLHSKALFLYISVSYHPSGIKPTSLVIYKIEDLGGDPKGSQIAHLTMPRPRMLCRIASADGNRVAFYTGQNIGVWDFTKGTLAMWKNQPMSDLCLLSRGNVICHHEDGLAVYIVPRLHAVPDMLEENTLSPAIQLELRHSTDSKRSVICRLSDGSQFFDIRYENTVTRYIVQDLPPNITNVSVIPLKIGAFTTHQKNSREEVSYLPGARICDDGVFTGLSSLSSLQLHLSPRPFVKDGQALDATITLLDSKDPGYNPETS